MAETSSKGISKQSSRPCSREELSNSSGKSRGELRGVLRLDAGMLGTQYIPEHAPSGGGRHTRGLCSWVPRWLRRNRASEVGRLTLLRVRLETEKQNGQAKRLSII